MKKIKKSKKKKTGSKKTASKKPAPATGKRIASLKEFEANKGKPMYMQPAL